MIISYITGGLGNQLFQYAAGRRLALKLNTEFKLELDPIYAGRTTHPHYALDQFNITAAIATAEEIDTVKKLSAERSLGIEGPEQKFLPEVLNYPDNVYLRGNWINEKYFEDIRDILLKEFTLKNPGGVALNWQQKILAAECPVSMHFRHGDFLYHPVRCNHPWYAVPFDYYLDCLNALKQRYENITVFVFSDNLRAVKENLRLDVPTEFVCGEGITDAEELFLMSLCKHNILAGGSTFSMWGAWLNQNPDKKVFRSLPATTQQALQYRNSPTRLEKKSPQDSWIFVPFDANNRLNITIRPYFSLLLVVNDDAATVQETLSNILAQDYKFFEVIVIDNGSTDGSGKICLKAAQTHDNIRLIKLWDRVSDGAAWNKALDDAQGEYVLFLKGNDRFINNALSFMYLINENVLADIVNFVTRLKQDEHGDINLAGKKFSAEKDAFFRNLKGNIRGKFDKPTIFKILSEVNASILAAKIFKRKFLSDNGLRFDEKIGRDAELLFMVETMFHAKEMIFSSNALYVAPKNF